MSKTLLDLLRKADSVQIDDVFIRYFNFEHEDFEGEDVNEDIILRISAEVDYNLWQYEFTIGSLKEATYDEVNGIWYAESVASEMTGEVSIIPCKVTEIKP